MSAELNKGTAGEGAGQEGATSQAAGGQPPPAGQPSSGQPAAGAAGSGAAAGAAGAAGAGDDESSDVRLDRAQFNERIAQAKRAAAAKAEADHRAWLKAKFGTEDSAEAEKKLASLAKLEAEEEKRKRDAMSEQEKLQLDLKREREARAKAEARAAEAEASWQHEKQSAAITQIASSHVAPKHIRYATFEFANHVRSLPKDEQATLTEKDVTKWYAEFAKKNPEYAASAEQKQKVQDQQTQARRQAAGSGPAQGQPPPKPNAGPAGKDMRPGRPNSMTTQEARAALRKQGITY